MICYSQHFSYGKLTAESNKNVLWEKFIEFNLFALTLSLAPILLTHIPLQPSRRAKNLTLKFYLFCFQTINYALCGVRLKCYFLSPIIHQIGSGQNLCIRITKSDGRFVRHNKWVIRNIVKNRFSISHSKTSKALKTLTKVSSLELYWKKGWIKNFLTSTRRSDKKLNENDCLGIQKKIGE